MKVSLLIPVTSNRRSFKNLNVSPLISILLKSFLEFKEEEHEYTFYVGYDKGDRFYTLNKKEIQKYFKDKGVNLVYEEYHNPQKSPVFVWNKLFEDAYNNGEDYFYQIGDDIQILSEWSNKFIKTLQSNKDMGVTGPLDLNNSGLLTQSFVSRYHMETFGYYFPGVFKNWYCDDWIQKTYQGSDLFFKLDSVNVRNKGGDPRYVINRSSRKFLQEEVDKGIDKLTGFELNTINVYYNYYIPKDKQRQKEVNYCLNQLINSENIDNLYLFSSKKDYESLNINYEKVKFIDLRTIPTFKYVFGLMESNSGDNDYNISINSDCYIQESSYKYLTKLKKDDCWVLLRWDIVDEKMNIRHRNKGFSQDCWIIKGKPKKMDNINFNYGVPGCDNRISFELKKSGYNVFNPSKDFKVIHYHLSDLRYYTQEDRVNGDYLYINPTKISDINYNEVEVKKIDRRVSNRKNTSVVNYGLNRVRRKHWKLRRQEQQKQNRKNE